jgi:hypothetical protein
MGVIHSSRPSVSRLRYDSSGAAVVPADRPVRECGDLRERPPGGRDALGEAEPAAQRDGSHGYAQIVDEVQAEQPSAPRPPFA